MKNEKQIVDALRKCASSAFWGSVQIDFQHGQAVLLRIQETKKLNEGDTRYEPSKRTRTFLPEKASP